MYFFSWKKKYQKVQERTIYSTFVRSPWLSSCTTVVNIIRTLFSNAKTCSTLSTSSCVRRLFWFGSAKRNCCNGIALLQQRSKSSAAAWAKPRGLSEKSMRRVNINVHVRIFLQTSDYRYFTRFVVCNYYSLDAKKVTKKIQGQTKCSAGLAGPTHMNSLYNL